MNPVLVALDLDTASAASAMASRVHASVGGLKVGSHLFTAEGPDFVRGLVRQGHRGCDGQGQSPQDHGDLHL